MFKNILFVIWFLDAVLAFAQKASSKPNDLKMTMSDDISDPHKIPSNVTPWQAEETPHHWEQRNNPPSHLMFPVTAFCSRYLFGHAMLLFERAFRDDSNNGREGNLYTSDTSARYVTLWGMLRYDLMRNHCGARPMYSRTISIFFTERMERLWEYSSTKKNIIKRN